jgi:hypothetical protein
MTNDYLDRLQKTWQRLDFTDNITEHLRQYIHPSRRYEFENFLRDLFPPGDGD